MKKNKEKEVVKAKEREEKAQLKNVLITDTAESSIRKEQFNRDQGWKAEGRDTKSNLKNVLITETAESSIRKEQFNRDQGWKAENRDTKSNLKDVNMAVRVFMCVCRLCLFVWRWDAFVLAVSRVASLRVETDSLTLVTYTLSSFSLQVASFETEIRKEQHNREKTAKQAARDTKSNLKDVNMAVRHRQQRGSESSRVDSFASCRVASHIFFLSCTQVPSFETEVRKEQFSREQAAKQTARDTKTNLKDVNMACT